MAQLDAGMQEKIRERLLRLEGPVALHFFRETFGCDTSIQAMRLVQEVAALSDKLKLEVCDLGTDDEKAKLYGVDKAPALVVEGPAGARVRFYGVITGYAFAAFLEALKDAAAGSTLLGDAARRRLERLSQPVHIEVFVTPTCPHCPGVVRAAHRLAVEYPQITADMIEIHEFPELVLKYKVCGVPKIVINHIYELVGPVSEQALAAAAALSAAGQDGARNPSGAQDRDLPTAGGAQGFRRNKQ